MLKKYSKLRKLWDKMGKKATIRLFGPVVKFDKRKKETKEFEKSLCSVIIDKCREIDKESLKDLLRDY